MKLFDRIRRFGKDEDGAVTVDFVVLTAGVAIIGIAAALFFQDSLASLVSTVTTEIGDYNTDLTNFSFDTTGTTD